MRVSQMNADIQEYMPYRSHRELITDDQPEWTDEQRRECYRRLLANFPDHPQREWWEAEVSR